jgi:mRNA-degrading endonuclease RelE of RelBE toxin-antitoxin system
VYTVKLIPAAETEFAEACNWYEERLVGLGVRFFNTVSAKLNSIELKPYHYAVKFSETFRFANVRGFPYSIGYKIDDSNKVIHVLSIFHTSRNPNNL